MALAGTSTCSPVHLPTRLDEINKRTLLGSWALTSSQTRWRQPESQSSLSLFPEEPPTVCGRARLRQKSASTTIGDTELTLSATTLDQAHAAMPLQAWGRSQALRNLLRSEQERGPDFLRLAMPSRPSTRYPRGSEEKRLLDAMLLSAPR